MDNNKRKRITNYDDLCESESDENYQSDSSCSSEVFVKKNRKRAKVLSSSESEDSDSVVSDECDATNTWQWKLKDNTPQIWVLTEKPGINSTNLLRLGKSVTAMDVFNEVLRKDFWEMLSTETNRYAEQIISADDKSKLQKMDKYWEDTNSDEIQLYFALCLIMAQVKKSAVHLNWSDREIIETPIYKRTMPYERFMLISRFLHFTNNNNVAENSNKLDKINSVVKYMNESFQKIYTPEKNLSLDESLIKFKGTLSHLQSVIAARRPRLRFYKICESKSGYCSLFKIFTANDKPAIGSNAVMQLVKPFFYKGYTFFMDDWHSTPQLFLKLLDKRTNAIGTVKCNRKNMPKTLCTQKIKNHQSATQSSCGILALKWRDNEDIYLLSTKHKHAEMTDMGIKYLSKDKREVHKVQKPACILAYNEGMKSVDRHDNVVLSSFGVMEKFVKGYKKVFFYMMDMAVFNSFIIYCQLKGLSTTNKKHFVDFRLDIAESLLKIIPAPNAELTDSQSDGEEPLRLQAKQWAHFPQHIPPTNEITNPTRECKVCRKHEKSSETSWECKQCLVPLHVAECFEMYHTLKDY